MMNYSFVLIFDKFWDSCHSCHTLRVRARHFRRRVFWSTRVSLKFDYRHIPWKNRRSCCFNTRHVSDFMIFIIISTYNGAHLTDSSIHLEERNRFDSKSLAIATLHREFHIHWIFIWYNECEASKNRFIIWRNIDVIFDDRCYKNHHHTITIFLKYLKI